MAKNASKPANTAAKKTTKKTPAAKKTAAKKKTTTARPPKEELVVFACRVALAERTAFHEATGPGGASRFARALMVVFFNEDVAGFRALLNEARDARS